MPSKALLFSLMRTIWPSLSVLESLDVGSMPQAEAIDNVCFVASGPALPAPQSVPALSTQGLALIILLLLGLSSFVLRRRNT